MWASVITGVATLAGVGVGALLAAAQTRRHWMRDKVIDAAAEFIATSGAVYDFGRQEAVTRDSAYEARQQQLLDAMASSRARLHLLGSQDTRKKMEDLAELASHAPAGPSPDFEDRAIRALGAFTAEIRRQCDIPAIEEESGLVRGAPAHHLPPLA